MLVIARSIRSFVEDHVIHIVVMGPQPRSYFSGVVLESVFEKTLRWTRLSLWFDSTLICWAMPVVVGGKGALVDDRCCQRGARSRGLNEL